MMYRHSSAQVHGAKVQNNYGLCKIFAKIHKRIVLRLILGLSKKHSENMAKNETMCDHGATVRLYATQLWAKFASYGLAVQWLMNE